MSNTKIDLAELFRRIQYLNFTPIPEEEMELDFYRTLFSTFVESLSSDASSTLIPINFKVCSIEKAKEYALSLGLHIVEGSTYTYLSFSKGTEF